jgi:hypothetical protein
MCGRYTLTIDIEHRFGPKFIAGLRTIEYFPSLSKPKRPAA